MDRAEDSQGTPSQSHISKSILVFEDKKAPASRLMTAFSWPASPGTRAGMDTPYRPTALPTVAPYALLGSVALPENGYLYRALDTRLVGPASSRSKAGAGTA